MSFALVTSASASVIAPDPAVIPTAPSTTISPTVTVVPATNRAVAVDPELRNSLEACCVIAPASAQTSMLPPAASALVVRTSASRPKVTEPCASTLTLPLALSTSAFATTFAPAPRACSSTLPEPSAFTATPAVPAVPSVSVRLPPATTTIDPLPLAVVTTSLATASELAVAVPSACTVCTTTDFGASYRLTTLPMARSLVSRRLRPSEPETDADSVCTVVSSALTDCVRLLPARRPAPLPAERLRPTALISTAVSSALLVTVSVSRIEPAAVMDTLAVAAVI